MNIHKAVHQSTTVSKTIKLRESCDSCLVAKVKCSKTKPICGRCLANGANCIYSPSSRAGRKHRNAAATEATGNLARRRKSKDAVKTTSKNSSLCGRTTDATHGYQGRLGFGMPYAFTPDQFHPKHTVIPNCLLAAHVQGFEAPAPFQNSSWNDYCGDYLQPSPQASLFHAGACSPFLRSSDSQTPYNQTWASNGTLYSVAPSSQGSVDLLSPNSSLSSSLSDGVLPQSSAWRIGIPRDKLSHSCDCFAMCLQALEALHYHSWAPDSPETGVLSFDMVLLINREAVRGCAEMLDCVRCVSRAGSSISSMLLGTILGKIIALYEAACVYRFESTDPNCQAAVVQAYGAFADRRYLEIEIVILELKKIEGFLTIYQERFRGVEAEKDEHSLCDAFACYLDKNLRNTLEFLYVRRMGL